jgi:hypothetical protein
VNSFVTETPLPAQGRSVSCRYRRGDQVQANWGGDRGQLWWPGRVIGIRHRLVKVAAYQPYRTSVSTREIPEGTPCYSLWHPDQLVLIKRDPIWNPFQYMPALCPDDYVCTEGRIGVGPGYPGLTQVGAYQPATTYDHRDPVWGWTDCGWHPARVIEAKRSWISVHYLGRFRNRGGRPSESHRPLTVWPALCDYPYPNTALAKEFHG